MGTGAASWIQRDIARLLSSRSVVAEGSGGGRGFDGGEGWACSMKSNVSCRICSRVLPLKSRNFCCQQPKKGAGGWFNLVLVKG